MFELLIKLDYWLFNLINHGCTHPWLDIFMPAVTDLHKTSFFKMGVIPFIFSLMIYAKGLKTASKLFVGLLLTLGFTDFTGSALLKKTIQRDRPGKTPEVHAIVRSGYGGYSFISNHSANMAAAATFTFLYFPSAFLPMALFALTVMLSRVYNGVHFPLDVIGGAIWGILVTLSLYKATQLLKMRSGK